MNVEKTREGNTHPDNCGQNEDERPRPNGPGMPSIIIPEYPMVRTDVQVDKACGPVHVGKILSILYFVIWGSQGTSGFNLLSKISDETILRDT